MSKTIYGEFEQIKTTKMTQSVREPDIIDQKFDFSKIDFFWVNMPLYTQERYEIGLVWVSGHIFGVKYAHTLVIFFKPVTSLN